MNGASVFTLVVTEPQLDALVAGDTGGEWPGGALEEAGAAAGDVLDVGFAEGLAAVADPVCELAMQRGPRHGRGWARWLWSALVVPAGAPGRLRLHVAPTEFLPDVLARLNDLGPRPRRSRATALRTSPAPLAQLLAARDPALAATVAEGGEGRAIAAEIASGLREHWRIEASWGPQPDAPRARVLEVVDTDSGLWLVSSEGASVELASTTPTTVFRLLCALLPRAPAD